MTVHVAFVANAGEIEESIHFTPPSLDGYIADETGNLDWSAPDEDSFAFISDLDRPIGFRPSGGGRDYNG